MVTQNLSILIVDDNEDDVVLLRESLGEVPAARVIDVVHDGEAALAFLRQQGEFSAAERPDLVLLDINMPGKNGMEVLDEMRADPILRGIPVVMLTTSEREEDVARCYCAGANTYISKPASFDNFQSLARRLAEYWRELAQLPRIN